MKIEESKVGDSLLFDGSVFTCKCGLEVKIGKMEGEFCALHRMPMCAEFGRYELLDYMRWLRDARDN